MWDIIITKHFVNAFIYVGVCNCVVASEYFISSLLINSWNILNQCVRNIPISHLQFHGFVYIGNVTEKNNVGSKRS